MLSSNSVHDGPLQLFTFAMLGEFPADKAGDAAEVGRWSVRLTGRSDDVLRLWHAQTRWAGPVEVPLSTLLETERARMKDKAERCFVWMP